MNRGDGTIENTVGGAKQTLEFCRNIITNTTRTKKKRKKENTELTRFDNYLRPWGRRGRRLSINSG